MKKLFKCKYYITGYPNIKHISMCKSYSINSKMMAGYNFSVCKYIYSKSIWFEISLYIDNIRFDFRNICGKVSPKKIIWEKEL